MTSDLSSAYQQLELEEDSKQYTVINTHRGLFRFNRLPFGISSAPGIFQRTMENLLNGIPCVIVYLNDILVSGVSKEDHLHNLALVLERLFSAGLLLKKEKCKFCVDSISYLGHKIDCEGLHPLPDKVNGITRASTPKSVTELKAFLGLMNYYAKFIPNLVTVLSPLYQLLSQSVPWSWTCERDAAFKKAKLLLTSDCVLVHFDPEKEYYHVMLHPMDWVQSCITTFLMDPNVLLHLLLELYQQLNVNTVRLRRRHWLVFTVSRNSIPTFMVVVFIWLPIINHYYHYFINTMPFLPRPPIEFGDGP